jgi:hypothetical protein
MRHHHTPLFLAACAALTVITLLGCPNTGGDDDDDASDDDDGAPPGGCGFPEGGTDGAASVTPATPVVHDSIEDQAMNTLDIEFAGQLPAGGSAALRYGPCGDAGMLLWLDDGGLLVYVDPRSGGAPETLGPGDGPFDGALFFDADCTPLALVPASPLAFQQYTRGGDGSWTASQAFDDVSTVLGSEPSSLRVFDADVGADGKLYVFVEAYVGGNPEWLRGSREAAAGSAWTFQAMTAPDATELFDVAVGTAGETVAAFKNTQYPCDPCDVDFHLGTLATPDGAWSTEVLQPGTWGDPNDLFVESASLAFGADGNPYVAAHFVERVITGSYVATELRLYGQVEGVWCGETIVDANDGYEGSDGSTYTGADPVLAFDDAGRMHVAFRDQAIWHDGGNQNEIRGQLRHAVRSGNTWTTATLLTQPGQTASAHPLIGVGAPLLAVSPDGTEVVVAGVAFEWETDSIYNMQELPVTLEATAVQATISYP